MHVDEHLPHPAGRGRRDRLGRVHRHGHPGSGRRPRAPSRRASSTSLASSRSSPRPAAAMPSTSRTVAQVKAGWPGRGLPPGQLGALVRLDVRPQPPPGQRRRHRGQVVLQVVHVDQQRRRPELGSAHPGTLGPAPIPPSRWSPRAPPRAAGGGRAGVLRSAGGALAELGGRPGRGPGPGALAGRRRRGGGRGRGGGGRRAAGPDGRLRALVHRRRADRRRAAPAGAADRSARGRHRRLHGHGPGRHPAARGVPAARRARAGAGEPRRRRRPDRGRSPRHRHARHRRRLRRAGHPGPRAGAGARGRQRGDLLGDRAPRPVRRRRRRARRVRDRHRGDPALVPAFGAARGRGARRSSTTCWTGGTRCRPRPTTSSSTGGRTPATASSSATTGCRCTSWTRCRGGGRCWTTSWSPTALFGAVCRAGARVPALVPPANRLATRLLGQPDVHRLLVPGLRLDPARVRFHETEWAVPRAALPAVLRELDATIRAARLADLVPGRGPGRRRRTTGGCPPRTAGRPAYVAAHRYVREP